MEFYKQTTKYTCAAAGLMMILNHFNPDFKLTRQNEFLIWHRSAVLPMRGSSIYALSLIAQDFGVKAEVVVGEVQYKFPAYRFRSYKLKEVQIADYSSNLFYNSAMEKGIKISVKEFGLEEVKQLLNKGKILLLRVNIGLLRGTKANKNIAHYLTVYNYGDGKFLVVDPLKGKSIVHEEQMQEIFETVKTKCKRDNRMIIFG